MNLRQIQLRFTQPLATTAPVSILQRKCACGQHTIAGNECASCRQESESDLQRSSINRGSANRYDDSVPPIVQQVLNSPGAPLAPATRAFFEQHFSSDPGDMPTQFMAGGSTSSELSLGAPNDRFEQEADLLSTRLMWSPAAEDAARFSNPSRHDFSHVRVHTDERATESAAAVNAHAYTVGRNIVFGQGQYSPGSIAGNRLLAHELTHVIQQQTKVGQHPIVQRQDKGKGDKGKSDKTDEKKSEKKAESWTRKHTDGPRLLDGENPSFQVWFDHIPPPVPKGVTQMWQVVENTKTFLSSKCGDKTEKDFRIDIVKIGDRKNLEDTWGWVRYDDPCFAMQRSKSTVGFDDQKSGFEQQTNVPATATLAKDVLKKMAGPIGTFTGTYTFVKSANCAKCPDALKKLQKANGAPDGEALAIDGVGNWTSESK
jgi:hypothetical protein